MQDTSRRTSTAIDTPPLSREEVVRLSKDLTQSYRQMFGKAVNLAPRLETMWERMQQLASRENVSVERLTGVLTVDVASWGKKGIGAALAVGQTGTDLFGEQILDSYSRTLDAVGEQGVTGYLSGHMTPFLQAATAHFDRGRKSLTESLLGTKERPPETTQPAPLPACPPEPESPLAAPEPEQPPSASNS
jgi:hypothetical protein